MGWVYTGPERFDTSLTEHTGWVNRNLGDSYFGAGSSAGTPTSGTFKDIYDDPDPQPTSQPPSFNYMTDEELADYNEANDTNFSGNYLSTHPQSGEAGMWTWDPQAGWRDDTQWTGPRTHYEDGTPITSFEDVRDGVFDDPAPTDADTTQPPADDSKSIDEICAGPIPEPGTFARQSYDRYCVSPTDPIVETPVAPTLPSTTTTAGSSGGVFTGMAPKGLSYSRQEAPSMISSAPKVDYIKLLRGFLTESLFKDMI